MNIVKKLVLSAMALSSIVSAGSIWESGDGAVSTNSTYWYVAAENGAGKTDASGGVTCGGTNFLISDFPDPDGEGGSLVFADDCIDGNGDIVVGLNSIKAEDTDGNSWGFALVGLDLAAPKADVQISAVSIDIALTGCSKITLVAKNSGDAANSNGDYSTTVKSGAQDIDLATFVYSAWAPTPSYTLAGDGVEAIHFKNESGTSCTVAISCLGTTAGACGADPVLATSNAAINLNLNGSELSFSTPEMLNVEVYDLQGRVVVTGTVSSNTSLDLSNLTQGSYIVRAAGESVSMINKISILD